MQAPPDHDKKLIAWNGVRLYIPRSWEARVSGNEQLIFERDFHPLLQLRWHNPQQHSPHGQKRQATKFVAQLGSVIPARKVPAQFQALQNSFKETTFFQDADKRVKGGACVSSDEKSLLLFQLLTDDASSFQEVTDCLTSFSCQDEDENLWRIQDFSLATPNYFTLKNYTFAAGLSRISFEGPRLQLQTCRLGPADKYLANQSLEKILITLTGCPELELSKDQKNANDLSQRGERTPTIFRQVVYRLRRERPFISAKVWLDKPNNRLLAVVLSSKRPIPLDTLDTICSHYEII